MEKTCLSKHKPTHTDTLCSCNVLRVVVDEEALGRIEAVAVEQNAVDANVGLYKGIYLVNGKVVILK